MSIDISIVVGTKNRPTEWRRFKDSADRVMRVPYEIVVGDASDEQYTVETANVRVLKETEPLGTLLGYNRCFRECRGKWVAWFNDDCELQPGWDTAAVEFMENNPHVGVGAIYFQDRLPDGTYGPPHGLPSDKGQFGCYSYPGQMIMADIIIPGIPHANFGVLSREVGDRLGWFDESMGCIAYGCDSSICLQAVNEDMAVLRIPGCKVVHHRAFDSEMNDRLETIRMDDLGKFNAKWRRKFDMLRLKHKRYEQLLGDPVIE